MSAMKITVLAGGVGAARFLEGLVQAIPPDDVTVIGNTGDDVELYGLHISPDLDIVTYTLAGIVDPEKGWGIRDDTYSCQRMLRDLGHDTWFNLGDRDLAVHIQRTYMLRRKLTLSEVTRTLARQFGVPTRIIPMSDDYVRTLISTENGLFHFQEYLVKRGAVDPVRGVVFDGADQASPAPGVIRAIDEADFIIIPPSNPIVSIGAILSIPGIREALVSARAPTVGVSPIVKGAPIKGPADKLLLGLGIEVSALGVAGLYRDLIDAFIIDAQDEPLIPEIRKLGIQAYATNTMMRSIKEKTALANAALSVIRHEPRMPT